MIGPSIMPKVNLEGDVNPWSATEWVVQSIRRAGADEEYARMVEKEALIRPSCCLDVLDRYCDLRINDML